MRHRKGLRLRFAYVLVGMSLLASCSDDGAQNDAQSPTPSGSTADGGDAASSHDGAPSDAARDGSDGGGGRTDGGGGGTDGGTPPPDFVGSNGGPQLLFTDLVSGPSSGNSDTSKGTGGAIVTVWGRGLGASQGASSKITLGGVAAPVYEWRNADGPASNMYAKHGMQMIAFLVPGSLAAGNHDLQVSVGGVVTNTLPFTVRTSGNIYYVKTSGADSNNGAWGTAWRTIPKAINSMANGDIIYVGDGVTASTTHEYHGCVNLNHDGTAALPRALVAYPGATVNVGGAGGTCDQPFDNWNSAVGGRSSYWVVSKIRALGVGGDTSGINVYTGYRLIGTFVRIPHPGDNSQSGMIGGEGNDFTILGNQIADSALENPTTITKLCHVMYLSGQRSSSQFGNYCGGVRCPTESNREIGWNLLNDNHVNRGIDIYSEQDLAAFMEGHKVHDNYIINNRGVGILIGYYITGENWFYNNVIINAGTGPAWGPIGEISGYHAMQINGGHASGRSTTLHVWHNSMYGGGNPGSGATLLTWFKFGSEAGIRVNLDFLNNVIVSPNVPYWSADAPLEATLDGTMPNLWFGQGAAPSWNTGAIAADPMFVNTGIGDLHLRAGSPAIDHGRAPAIAVGDFDGLLRPQGAGFDLGAFELK